MKKLRGLFRIIFGRTAFVVLFMAIQVGILFGAFRWLEEYMHIVYAISILLSAAVIIYIFNEPINSSFKMAWIVPVLVIPVFGVLLYIFVQMQFQTKLMARRLKKNIGDTAAYLKQDREVQERIREASRRSSHLIDYMKDHARTTTITDWLLQRGFLEMNTWGDGTPFRGPTALGRSIGLSVEERSGKRGPYQVTLYHPDAQHFILDNLDDILSPVSATAE